MLSTADNILSGGPLGVNLVDNVESLADFILKRLSQQSSSITLIDGVTSDGLTNNALLSAAIRVANSLRGLGVTHADKVAIYSENRLEAAATMFGTLLLGATLVMVNPTYTVREVQHALQLTKPKVLFASETSVASACKVAEQSDFIQNVISFDGGSKNVTAFADFTEKNQHVNETDFRCTQQNLKTKVAFILYSSGTTGLPKGVELTELNILMTLYQLETYVDEEELKLVPESVNLSISPWSHVFGCMRMIDFIVRGHKLVFMRKFEGKNYLAAIQTYKVNTIHVVPPIMVFLAKQPIVAEYDLSSLKVIRCGAAPLSKELEKAVLVRIGVSLVRQGYGMTEATLTLTRQNSKWNKEGSVGVLVAGMAGRVVDVDTGRCLPANQRGELQFSGPSIMKGYIGDAEATRATIDADGWLRTGDIGYYDADGEWFIVDRLKELIKYNGFQVPPAEIEGILLQHPLISDAGVVGVPDERTGELPMAFVVRQTNGGSLTEREVMEFVAERASKAKWLHGGVRFIAAIPKNPSGKILRRELRSLLGALPSKL